MKTNSLLTVSKDFLCLSVEDQLTFFLVSSLRGGSKFALVAVFSGSTDIPFGVGRSPKYLTLTQSVNLSRIEKISKICND